LVFTRALYLQEQQLLSMISKNGPILIVEDDEDDKDIILSIISDMKLHNEVFTFVNGEQAYEFLLESPKQPFLILCDINMPRMNGIDLKRKIEENEHLRYKSVPFIYFTTSYNQEEIRRAYDLIVQGFFIKENSYEALKETLRLIVTYWQKCKHPIWNKVK
jgi:CheY-like chemotaxis protein